MGLGFRHATLDDVDRLVELAATGSRDTYDPQTLTLLPSVWRAWLKEKRCTLHCLIDDSKPLGRRVQGYALGVFVTDAFSDGLLAQPRPFVAPEVVRREARGESVVLTAHEVARANAGEGLNALGMDLAFGFDWGPLTLVQWSGVFLDSLREWWDGWQARASVREWIGSDLANISRLNGWPVVADFSKALTPRPPWKRRRYLVGMTRAQHQRTPGRLPAALFFARKEPQFAFAPAEQELLLLALRNATDAEAANALGISIHTVKARWKAIFLQVADQNPDWFPGRSEDDREEPTGRGVEKRRHLLAWLARHIEELRPRAR